MCNTYYCPLTFRRYTIMMSHEQIVRIAEAKEEALEAIKKFAVLSGMASSDTVTDKQILHSALDFIISNRYDLFSTDEVNLSAECAISGDGEFDWILAKLLKSIYAPEWTPNSKRSFVEIKLKGCNLAYLKKVKTFFENFGFIIFESPIEDNVMVITPSLKFKELFIKKLEKLPLDKK